MLRYWLWVLLIAALFLAVIGAMVANAQSSLSHCETTVFAQTADTLWMQTRCVVRR